MLSGQGRGGGGVGQRFSLLSDERLPLALFICAWGRGGGRGGSDREKECYSPAVHHSREKVEAEGKIKLCRPLKDVLIVPPWHETRRGPAPRCSSVTRSESVTPARPTYPSQAVTEITHRMCPLVNTSSRHVERLWVERQTLSAAHKPENPLFSWDTISCSYEAR